MAARTSESAIGGPSMSEVERAQKSILKLLDKRDLHPSSILERLSGSFDELTLRRALLDLVTQQEAEWKPGRRLSRRHPEVVHG
jgi:hypothetical protein